MCYNMIKICIFTMYYQSLRCWLVSIVTRVVVITTRIAVITSRIVVTAVWC